MGEAFGLLPFCFLCKNRPRKNCACLQEKCVFFSLYEICKKLIEFSLCIGYNAKKGKYTPMKIPRRSCKKMSKLSLAGAWKLRGEFMDVTAERYNEVLRKMDAAPVRATLPAS